MISRKKIKLIKKLTAQLMGVQKTKGSDKDYITVYNCFRNGDYSVVNTTKLYNLYGGEYCSLLQILEEHFKEDNGAALDSFCYTFGTDPTFPYRNGWVEVRATSWEEAHAKFRWYFPDIKNNVLNCAFVYTKEEFEKTGMQKNTCHKIIV